MARLLKPVGRCRGLAVELHGSGLDADRQYHLSGLAGRLLSREVAVLLPQGEIPFRLSPELAPGYAWNVPGSPLPGGCEPTAADDDVAWLDALVSTARRYLELGREPSFIAGYSGGARFASHHVAVGETSWAAAALVAGLRIPPVGLVPPPTISFHGIDDRVNPFLGGDGKRWGMGVDEASDGYAARQGCRDRPVEDVIEGARRRIFRGPSGSNALVVYVVAGTAHAWPGSVDHDHLRHFGPAGSVLDASDLITSFFEDFLDLNVEPSDINSSLPSGKDAYVLARSTAVKGN